MSLHACYRHLHSLNIFGIDYESIDSLFLVGQKLTLLSKQPVSTIGNAGHAIAKALIKFQFSTVTTATTSTSLTTSVSKKLWY